MLGQFAGLRLPPRASPLRRDTQCYVPPACVLHRDRQDRRAQLFQIKKTLECACPSDCGFQFGKFNVPVWDSESSEIHIHALPSQHCAKVYVFSKSDTYRRRKSIGSLYRCRYCKFSINFLPPGKRFPLQFPSFHFGNIKRTVMQSGNWNVYPYLFIV
jgi:hypothetical protein